ncbi:CLUMA_CG003572, isoform A [Clunio marinus]|uniref:CLUMA_CG003572, isoform A n=1 Tax=Clunio marinus TaxID=568069 RepID=A0A1J1HTL7_9DIPT|nr:CLUMA_CG003572, isoform A [Clunio marinus]
MAVKRVMDLKGDHALSNAKLISYARLLLGVLRPSRRRLFWIKRSTRKLFTHLHVSLTKEEGTTLNPKLSNMFRRSLHLSGFEIDHKISISKI